MMKDDFKAEADRREEQLLKMDDLTDIGGEDVSQTPFGQDR